MKYTFLTVPLQVLIGLVSLDFRQEPHQEHLACGNLARHIYHPDGDPSDRGRHHLAHHVHPQVSILNYWVTSLGGAKLAWLGDPNLALIALAIANMWEFFPFCFMILYAGLQSLPEEPLEAARVDGASGWQTLRYVTLPMLRPVLSIVILFQLVDSIRAFPLVYIMTDGGPGFVTEPTNYYAFQKAFNYSYIGYSSCNDRDHVVLYTDPDVLYPANHPMESRERNHEPGNIPFFESVRSPDFHAGSSAGLKSGLNIAGLAAGHLYGAGTDHLDDAHVFPHRSG